MTVALAIAPTVARAKGQILPAGIDGRDTRRQRTGVWALSSEATIDSTSLEQHLVSLLDLVEPAATEIAALQTRGLRTDFFCYWRSATDDGGPEVSPSTLKRIAALSASLGIDFAGPFMDE